MGEGGEGGGDCSFKVPDSFQTSQSLHRAAEGPPSGRKCWKRNGVSHQTKCDKLVFGSYTHACTYLKMCLVASTHHRGTWVRLNQATLPTMCGKLTKIEAPFYLSIGMLHGLILRPQCVVLKSWERPANYRTVSHADRVVNCHWIKLTCCHW